ncbi:MAG TPA: hypothetical protein VG675_12190 [Bryobacteraceae bacterium]|nr:hypothetical protein [Bryobacteraceae bacterium]
MIAAVKGRYAALSSLLFLIPHAASASEDLKDAARNLAQRTIVFAGRGEAVSLVFRNVSSLGSPESEQARSAFEAALQAGGSRIQPQAAVQIRLTLSENQTQYLLVEEIRRDDQQNVWIAAWKRAETQPAAMPAVALEKKLVWRQDEPMLDVAFPSGGMLVLSPSKLSLFHRQNNQWQLAQWLPIASPKPWPRDLRGRLRLNGPAFSAYLPGLACSGSTAPQLSMRCQPSDAPWVLESGSHSMLLASFLATRNYFGGRVVTQTGESKTVAPFFTAASAEDGNQPVWLLAMLDGRTRIFNAAFDPIGAIPAWGSDIAGTEASCGGGAQVLATLPVDGSEPDAVQAFAVTGGAVSELSGPVTFAGPVTALWPSGPASVLAIERDLATDKYAAHVITVVCGS